MESKAEGDGKASNGSAEGSDKSGGTSKRKYVAAAGAAVVAGVASATLPR